MGLGLGPRRREIFTLRNDLIMFYVDTHTPRKEGLCIWISAVSEKQKNGLDECNYMNKNLRA